MAFEELWQERDVEGDGGILRSGASGSLWRTIQWYLRCGFS